MLSILFASFNNFNPFRSNVIDVIDPFRFLNNNVVITQQQHYNYNNNRPPPPCSHTPPIDAMRHLFFDRRCRRRCLHLVGLARHVHDSV